MKSDISLSVDLTADEAVDTSHKLADQIMKIFTTVNGKSTTSIALDGLLKQLNEAYNRSIKAEEAVQAALNGPVENPKYTALVRQEEEVVTKMQEIGDKIKHVNELIDASQKVYGHSFARLDVQAEQLTNEYNKLENELKNINAEKAEFEKGGTAYTDNLANATASLGSANNTVSLIIRRIAELNEIPVPTDKWEKLGQVFYKIGTIIGTVINKSVKAFKNIFVSSVKVALSAVKKLAVALKEVAATKIKNGISKLSRGFLGIGKSANSSNVDLKKALKTLIKYTFGVRSFFFLYRKIRKAVTEGFGDLAQYSGDLNKKVSMVSTSLLYLRNAITTAFAPIVNFVAPILSKFLDLLAQATTGVGQFFAALLGQTSFVRATKVYKDYAKSLDTATKATTKNTKETKKNQKQLAGFDDVEILKKDDDKNNTNNNTDTSALNPWEDPSQMFETVKVGEKFKELADKIKGFFKNGDWEGLGKFLGNGINKAFATADALINSDALRNKVNGVVDAITRTFNSLVRTINWPLIGKTIGDGVNFIIDTINRFNTGIDWKRLGKSLADGANSLFDTINWKNLGQYFANNFNSLVDIIFGVVTNFRWGDLGTSLGNAINSMLLNIKWTELASTLAKLVNGLFSFLYNLATTIRWTEIATKLTTALDLFVRTVRWADIGRTLSTLFNGALSFLVTAVSTFNWSGLAEKIGEFLLGIDWKKLFLNLFKLLIATAKGLATFLATGLATILGAVLGTILGTVLSIFTDIAKYIKNKSAGEIIQGLKDGIIAALVGILNWVVNNIFKPFIKAFQSAFGISSPSKKMFTQGTYIIKGMLNGIVDGLKSIGSWVKTNVFDKVYGAFNTAFGIAGSVAGKLKDVGTAIIEGIKSGVSNHFSSLKSTLTNVSKNIYDTIKNGKSWSGIGSAIINGIASGIKSGWSWLQSTVSSLASSLYTAAKRALGIASPSKVFRDKVGKMITEGLAVGIDSNSSSAISAVQNLANDLTNAATKQISLPPIASGQVIPYSVGKSNTDETNDTLNKVLDMLQYNQNNGITISDLESSLETLLRRYLNIKVQLGDVEVARSANRGNELLDRRFNPRVG